MDIGICGFLDRPMLAKRAGFDFIEPSAYQTSQMSDAAIDAAKQSLAEAGLHAPAFNLFLPGELHTVGDKIEPKKNKAYLELCLAKCKRLGAEVIVYGSGRTRNIPEGYDKDLARSQLIAFLQMAGEEARKQEITIVIEPLYQGNSNHINTVAEGLELCKMTDHPNIRLLADSFHMIEEKEEPDILQKAGPYLRHIHLRDANLQFPQAKDEPYFQSFVNNLKKVDYLGRISMEVDRKPDDEDAFIRTAQQSVALIRRLIEEEV